MAKKVTIQMVAAHAGVSRGTVDRVLNQRPHVRPEQKERVLAAIRELGYEPARSEQAQALGITPRSSSVLKLGVLLPGRNEFFLKEAMRGIRDAQTQLADFSIEVLTETVEDGVPDELIAAMDRLVAAGAGGIAISGLNHPRLCAHIDALAERGIPTVTFESDVPGSRRLCFFGENLNRVGRVAGGLLVPLLEPGDVVIAASGSAAIEEDRIRVESFTQALTDRGFPEKNILETETYGDYRVTYSRIAKLLEEEPRIRGIYMVSHSLNGCMDAVISAGLTDRVHVLCSEVTRASLRYLKRGQLDFCVSPNVYSQGYQPLFILQDYLLRHQKPAAQLVHAATEILCSENLPALL